MYIPKMTGVMVSGCDLVSFVSTDAGVRQAADCLGTQPDMIFPAIFVCLGQRIT